MIFRKKIKKINWDDSEINLVSKKIDLSGKKIKYNADLFVKENQSAVFSINNQVTDIFKSGKYKLNTVNLPELSMLYGWDYNYKKPFNADIFFINLNIFNNLKWGTKTPVLINDLEFGPVKLKSYGLYNFKVNEEKIFLKKIVKFRPELNIKDLYDPVRSIINSKIADVIIDSNISILDLSANYDYISSKFLKYVREELSEMGLEMTGFMIENISLPDKVVNPVDKKSKK